MRGTSCAYSAGHACARFYVSYFRVYSEAPLDLNSLNWILLSVLCIPLILFIILSMQVRCFREEWIISLKTQIRLDEIGQRKDGSSDNFSVLMFKTLVLKTILLMVYI